MSLKDRINQDLKTAMKAKDQMTLRGIRAIKAAILLAETDGSGKALDEQREIGLLQKLVKQRKDSLDIYEKQDREDLASKEREEIEVISRYLPEQLDESKIQELVQEIIAQVGATGMKDMGKIMGMATSKLAGRADNKTVAGIVRQLLQG